MPFARRCPASVRAGGHVRQDLDAEAFHHALEYRRLRKRPVVETDRGRNALEWVPFVARLRLLGRHGVEQEAERRLDILAIDAAVFLVGDARAIIHDGEQHQGGRTLPIRVDPGRRLQVLQVRRACRSATVHSRTPPGSARQAAGVSSARDRSRGAAGGG